MSIGDEVVKTGKPPGKDPVSMLLQSTLLQSMQGTQRHRPVYKHLIAVKKRREACGAASGIEHI